ncbi:MAG TPA: hypothetical protein VG712_07195 [Gemmatimonadales bacterium]|nr:hypothetical protein [Gemmatimonadales bacterium]
MRALLVLGLALLAGVCPPALSAQSGPDPRGRHHLDSLLTDQATALLERYGDTFYILGEYLDLTGTPYGMSARARPPLDAAPDDWVDSLRAAFTDFRPQMRAAAYLVDRWRQLDSTRADSTFVLFHFEDAAGNCYTSRRRYHWAPSGSVVWDPPLALPCRRELWAGAPGVPH